MEELNPDLSIVTNKLNNDDSKKIPKKLNSSIGSQELSNSPTKHIGNEVNLIKDESIKNEKRTFFPSTQKSNIPPSFNQLRRLSSLSTTEDIAIQNIPQEEQQHPSAVRRREGAHRHRPGLRHLPAQPGPLLPAG